MLGDGWLYTGDMGCFDSDGCLTLRDRTKDLVIRGGSMGADLTFEDIIDEVAGVYPKVMETGDMEAGAWSCGMVAGLINDVPSVQELIDRIMAEANQIINERLRSFL